MTELNDHYVSGAPAPQNIADIFKGQWVSKFPAKAPCVSGGVIPLFEDARIGWMLGCLGGALTGKTVAELGPLEGGHSYMLHNAGAERIVAVEGNTLNFLKTALAKEIFGLDRLELLCGELEAWLARETRRFDVMVASGVLYHFNDPLAALHNMCGLSDTVFIWTHFVHDALMPPGDPSWGPFTGEIVDRAVEGYTCKYYKRSYRGSQKGSTFCGGILPDSVWMTHDDIVYALMHYGFEVYETMSNAATESGPSACFLARRKTA